MSNTVCELRDVSVFFGRFPALRDVSLGVEEGELLGLFGHNGAGKSTMLRAILGLVPTTSGQILIGGTPVSKEHLPQLRRRIGYVPQMLNVQAGAPILAWEVVMTAHYAQIGLGRFPALEHREAARRALQVMGVQHLAHKPFGHLSGGEQQRVLLARAIAAKPQLLLLDEPTSSVDWQFTRELVQIIRETHLTNALTTIVVSHDASFLARLCDRVVLLEQGRILGETDGRELLTTLERVSGDVDAAME